jgi:LytR cell envelope-related transcriptional attenuator
VSHVVESAASRRHRRNRRTAVVLLVLTAVLAGAFYYAASYFNSPAAPAATGCPTDEFTAGAAKPIAPGQITVNVLNATTRAGLAADTAKNVKARGFVVGNIANDPAKKKIDGPAEVRFGPNGKDGAEVVMKLVDGAAPVQDTRADASIDLVLGNGFQALTPAPTSTPTVPNPC